MATAEQKIPKIRKADIDDLKRDFAFYPRESVDYATVSRFMDAMRSGAKFPPLKVCANTGRIIDGFHRYGAYQQLGVKSVDVIGEEPGNDAEFFFLAISANKAHGLGYSANDQQKIVKLAARLGLTREKIALAVALPIQKVTEMVRNLPNFKPEDKPQPINFTTATTERSDGHWAKKATHAHKPKTDAITSSGFLFYCNQVIRFMRSDLCDVKDESIFSKIRELESCITSQLNPNKLKDIVCEKIKEGAATYADLSIELGIPESQIKAIVEELEAVGRLNKGKQPKHEKSRGGTREMLTVEDDPTPTPRDGRVSHPAIQAFKTATGYYPTKLLYDQVIETIGDFPDVTRMNQVFVAWVGRGYNPKNLSWLEWYANGIPERNGNGNGKNRPETASSRNVRNMRESLDYLKGLSSDSGKTITEGETRLLTSGS